MLDVSVQNLCLTQAIRYRISKARAIPLPAEYAENLWVQAQCLHFLTDWVWGLVPLESLILVGRIHRSRRCV